MIFQTTSNNHPTRVRHTIRLSNIRHNYNLVLSEASKQKCTVITVVKADGYGHGSIETALYLADNCGADAFAVATLEEGIALRKAFLDTASTVTTSTTGMMLSSSSMSNHNNNFFKNKNQAPITTSSLCMTPPKSIDVRSPSATSSIATSIKLKSNICTLVTPTTTDKQEFSVTNNKSIVIPMKKIRSNNIRIIVLGPPTNVPNDFNLYLHYNIEVMISSTKMARALMDWVADWDSRKIAEVDHIANETKQELLASPLLPSLHLSRPTQSHIKMPNRRKLLLRSLSLQISSSIHSKGNYNHHNTPFPFKGIEDTAKESRRRELAAKKFKAHLAGETVDHDCQYYNNLNNIIHDVDHNTQKCYYHPHQQQQNQQQQPPPDIGNRSGTLTSNSTLILNEDELDDGTLVSTVSSAVANAAIHAATTNSVPMRKTRKRIRWHALIDSGMGRLFRLQVSKR